MVNKIDLINDLEKEIAEKMEANRFMAPLRVRTNNACYIQGLERAVEIIEESKDD